MPGVVIASVSAGTPRPSHRDTAFISVMACQQHANRRRANRDNRDARPSTRTWALPDRACTPSSEMRSAFSELCVPKYQRDTHSPCRGILALRFPARAGHALRPLRRQPTSNGRCRPRHAQLDVHLPGRAAASVANFQPPPQWREQQTPPLPASILRTAVPCPLPAHSGLLHEKTSSMRTPTAVGNANAFQRCAYCGLQRD